MAKLIPGAGELILPEVSHFALLQDPAGFNDALLHFLSHPHAQDATELGGKRQNQVCLHRAVPDAVLEGDAFQKLHRNERLTVLVVNFVDRADVRMVQRRSRLRLALETGESLCVFGDFVRQELQGDKAAQLYILSLINHTHAATADFLDDAVVRNGLPDERVGTNHSAAILGCESWASQRTVASTMPSSRAAKLASESFRVPVGAVKNQITGRKSQVENGAET